MTTLSEYSIQDLLGEGGFGKVHLAVHKRTQEKVAIKFVNGAAVRDPEKVFGEIKALMALDHQNIVRILNCMTLKNMQVVIVMEYIEDGELALFVKERKYLTEQEAFVIFNQLFQAMQYCHSNRIIHRDLKLQNILMSSKEKLKIKVVDFGIAGFCDDVFTDETDAGTLKYIAPEILTRKHLAPTPALDIWAMGCILYALVHGYTPFQGNKKEIIQKITNGEFAFDPVIEKTLSPELKDLIHLILNPDHTTRITLGEMTVHPWLLGLKLSPSLSSKVVEEEKKSSDNTPKSALTGPKNKVPDRRKTVIGGGREFPRKETKTMGPISPGLNDRRNLPALVKKYVGTLHEDPK
eukprot:TRINITY_DN6885_c0_g1_i11.p1 TRINITY_DN6885_c0_g1~~TRINITY_DN6885_c0_g1_i11.p1  ORF type:complete len:351 (+),score=65.09 TRINITY_DN6885_c0_g1_i11:173-1225(+)